MRRVKEVGIKNTSRLEAVVRLLRDHYRTAYLAGFEPEHAVDYAFQRIRRTSDAAVFTEMQRGDRRRRVNGAYRTKD